MPEITKRAAALLQTLGILGTELAAPCPNRLVAQRDTALEHHFFNIPIAQAVPEIHPNAPADNFNRVTMAMIVTGKMQGIIRSRLAQLDNAAARGG
jgi:hypothetical protein